MSDKKTRTHFRFHSETEENCVHSTFHLIKLFMHANGCEEGEREGKSVPHDEIEK